ncbi:hypothetical protein FA15DRAFT_220180 [Coprinopsis marcescibilis]|uniref:Uncharacterized protein n=1 Tax=Coprinopsis marcescibilis TaxID=230819 RepID=A0A5C3L2S2_COPMA|nr:hypothetical protein FA15DRAFT_220180 [Coprinopsis marcescibilis]
MRTVPYALRLLKTDAREEFEEYDPQYIVLGEQTGIMPYRMTFPHLHTIEVEDPDTQFAIGTPLTGASIFVAVLDGMKFKAPKLYCVRIPIVACKYFKILCQPVFAPFKRVELVYDLSVRHLQGADIASWVFAPPHTIHPLENLETIVISFINGGFPRPEHPPTIFDPNTDLKKRVVMGALGTHSVHDDLLYPDVESFLADFKGALAWEKIVELARDPEMFNACPNWNRLLLDFTQLKKLQAGFVPALKQCVESLLLGVGLDKRTFPIDVEVTTIGSHIVVHTA